MDDQRDEQNPELPADPKVITNRAFTKDGEFQAACAAAGVEPTKRQASKYRRKMGAAYNAR